MDVFVNRLQEAYVLTLSGRWDIFSAEAFEKSCRELVAEGMRQVVINLEEVDYVSSFGMRSLLNLGKLLEPLHGRIHVCALQPQVYKIFTGSGFGTLFPSYPDVATALCNFREKE